MRILTLILGLLVLDQASVVDTLAGLAGTDEAAVVAVFGYIAAILIFVGAALAIPAPRGAATIFVIAALVGAFLGLTTIWTDMLVWSAGALLLALFAFMGHRRKQRKARRIAERAAKAEVGLS